MTDPVVRVEASMTRTSASAFPRGAMSIAPVVEALGDRAPEEPAALVRLLLLANDEVTGEQILVGSFLRRISIPPDLASPHVQLALEIFGERRLFKPTDIIWDEAHRVCIVEVELMVAVGVAISPDDGDRAPRERC
jgi:hypothetical protein